MTLKRRWWIILVVLFILLLGSMYIHLVSGSFPMSTSEVWKTFLRIESNDKFDLVIFDFRLPRIITAAIVGMGLAAAGVVLQGITKNPLADPGILGINAGAGASIVIFLFFFQIKIVDEEISNILQMLIMPIFGFVGGAVAAIIILFMSYKAGRLNVQRLILTGIAINSGFGAIILFWSLRMEETNYNAAEIWMNGSIYNANWYFVIATLPWILLIGIYIYRKAHILDYFQLEDDTVVSLGITIEREKIKLLIASVGLVSACVSVSGSIGFIGLMAPHIARQLVGIKYRNVMPISMLIGSVLVVFSDYVAKTLFSPTELSLGIVVSIVGIPYFLYLLARAKG